MAVLELVAAERRQPGDRLTNRNLWQHRGPAERNQPGIPHNLANRWTCGLHCRRVFLLSGFGGAKSPRLRPPGLISPAACVIPTRISPAAIINMSKAALQWLGCPPRRRRKSKPFALGW